MRPIRLEQIVELPLPGTGGPHGWRFVGDRHLIWFAPRSGSLVQELVGMELPDGAPSTWVAASLGTDEGGLSLEEKLRRERLRERALGVTSVRVAGGGRTLLVPMGGELWVDRVEQGVATGRGLRRVVEAPALDPQLSPDGKRVGWVRDAELYVTDLASGESRQLTHGARGTGKTHGLAEFVAQEEMHRRFGFWWSPDGARIAFTEVDETGIPIWRIPYEGKAAPSWEDHRYPFAGADNARVRLFVVTSDVGDAVVGDPVGGDPVEVDLGDCEYLARVAWLSDGALLVQTQDRRQRALTVRRVDPATGAGRDLFVERSDTFVELDDLFRALEREPGAFLWGSERSGFRHLHHVGATGEVRALTSGEWLVDEICAVDEAERRVYFLASEAGPLERQLYRVSMDGGPVERLTVEPGWHTVTVDLRGRRFTDTLSGRAAPPGTALKDLGGTSVRVLHASDDPRVDGLVPPELTTVRARNGDVLHAAFYRPEGTGPFPTVVAVYGGPHAQRVADQWDLTIDLRAQHLRSRGIATLRVDNRGSGRRGHAWAAALYGETGRVEIEDQADAVRQLVERGWIDGERVGVGGWSYGGYLTLMAMFREPELFRVGVAGAPVTHWDTYDTHYTERYMGLPSENADGYERSSALAHVDGLKGKLMVVHGMIDENVHFRHTGRLVNALVAARKEFELLIFPDERHLPRKPADRLYMEQRIVRFFVEGLGLGPDAPG